MQGMIRTSLLISTLSLSATASAGIYKWVDASGHTHYSQNRPPSGIARAPIDRDGVTVVNQRWSDGMKQKARQFMNKARVKRIWVNQNGDRVEGWY